MDDTSFNQMAEQAFGLEAVDQGTMQTIMAIGFLAGFAAGSASAKPPTTKISEHEIFRIVDEVQSRILLGTDTQLTQEQCDCINHFVNNGAKFYLNQIFDL